MRFALSLCFVALLLLLLSHSPTLTSARNSNEIQSSPSSEHDQETLGLDSLEKSRKMVVQIKKRLRTRIPGGTRARTKSSAGRDDAPSRLIQAYFVISFSMLFAFLM
ncbi:hypothetical protein Salat_2626100 [Sesamum alatum]|uniref:Transmembrane protein n=1 Tax=Sesamum alatum TaxID=300844 RepID=A0AAE2CAL9_9LAMI|nr:hypothetical protein Salat_2626100 [Sesamum alatum]